MLAYNSYYCSLRLHIAALLPMTLSHHMRRVLNVAATSYK